MKKIYKYLFSIILLFGLLFFIFSASFEYIKISKPFYEKKEKYYEICNMENYDDLEEWDLYYCETEYPYNLGFTSLMDSVISKLNNFILPLIFIIVGLSVYYINKILHQQCLKNMIIRESYRHFIFKLLKDAYSFIWIIPLCMFLMILFGICKFGYDLSYATFGGNFWNISRECTWLFIILYLVNIIIYLSVFINIGLIISRKTKNYITTLITTFLVIILIQLFLEIIVRSISVWNIMNFFVFDDTHGLGTLIFASCTWFIISWIGVYFAYRNKEKLYLESELK